jgi:Mn-dependent DtxR family transcriptional regulator
MGIYESAEDYLETILKIKTEQGKVRSIDIARAMNYSKPSVSRAMRLLRENECIVMDEDGWIELLPKGQEIASEIYERHLLFTKWLVALGVDPEVAAEDACKIEHDISRETFQKMKAHIEAEHPNL